MHLSPLLRKVRRLGFARPEDLLGLAAARGCHHYAPSDIDVRAVRDPGTQALSDEELGIAMISAAQENDPRLIRCAAQLVSGPALSAAKLSRLAVMERCTPLLAYIASHAVEADTERPAFWKELLGYLPEAAPKTSAQWPHPSRFMIQAGYQRGGGAPASVWLRPRAGEALR